MASTMNRDGINLLDSIKEAIGKGKSIINGLTKAKAQEELGVSRKNWIINGDHQVNQRANLPITGYTDEDWKATDRWKLRRDTITADAALGTSIYGATLKITATSTGTGSYLIGAMQPIEDYSSLSGKTCTLSAWVKSNNSNARIYAFSSGGTEYSDYHTGGGGWEQLSVTFTNSGSITNITVYVLIYTGASITITSGDYIEFTNASLEIGDTSTIFTSRSYAEELSLCRRYYRKQAFYVPATTAQTLGVIDMYSTPTITGGGTGFTSTGTTKDTLIAYQTTAGVQTLELNSEL